MQPEPFAARAPTDSGVHHIRERAQQAAIANALRSSNNRS
jgi:hypothetical protein